MPAADPLAEVFRQACADLDRRLRAGESVAVEEWVAADGPLAGDADLAVELIFTEYVVREELGPPPTPDEYYGRFPAHADRLRRLFGVDQLLQESAGHGRDTSHPAERATHGPTLPGPLAPPPDRIGPYELREKLGAGGMGVVYRCWHPVLRRDVAVKLLRAGGHATPDDAARLRKEAEAVARLNHPGIVQIYEVGEHDGQPYLALEYVGGPNLRQHLGDRALSAHEAADLVEAVARAAHHAHSHGVVHRDLKPANVLLAVASGQWPVVRGREEEEGGRAPVPPAPSSLATGHWPLATAKVTDFGLAAVADPRASLSASGRLVGTAAYMAPEQAEGRPGWVAPAVDVYALGAVLYECLTGRPPFLADTPVETLRRIVHDEPVPPRRLNPTVPRDLETVCLKCLQKEPRRRYPSAEALADDLRRFLDGEPVVARRASGAERGVKWARRNPALATAAAVTLAALVALGVGGFVYADDLKRERDATAAQKGEADRQKDEVARAKEQADREKDRAEREKAAADALRDKTRDLWYATQLVRAVSVVGTDPKLARELLLNETACPPDRREFAWRYLAGLSNTAAAKGDKHTGPITGLSASADGAVVATIDAEGSLQVWDGATGAYRSGAPREPRAIAVTLSVAVAGNGKRLVTGASNGRAHVWDAEARTPTELPLKLKAPILAVAMTADGSRVAVGAPGEGVRVLDATTGAVVATMPRAGATPRSLAFSPDGAKLAAGYAARAIEGEVVLWDVATEKAEFDHPFVNGLVGCVAFSPDGSMLAAAALARNPTAARPPVKTFAVRGGTIVSTLPIADGAWAVAFSPDGRSLAVGTARGNVSLWDARTGVPGATLPGHERTPAPPTGRVAVTTRKLPIYTDRFRPADDPDAVAGVAFVAGGRRLISAGYDRSVRVWELDPKRARVALEPEGYRVTTFAAERNSVLVGGADGAVRRWMPATGATTTVVAAGPLAAPVTALVVSPDGKRFAAAAGPAVTLYAADGTAVRAIHPTGVPSLVRFADDGRTLVALVGRDLVAWDADTGKERFTATVPGRDPVSGLAATAAEVFVASRGGIDVLDAGTGKARGRWPGVPDGLTGVAFHPSAGRVAVAGRATTAAPGGVALYDRAGAAVPYAGRITGAEVLAVSADGETVATLASNGDVRVWHARTGQELLAFPHQADLIPSRGLAFAPGGRFLVGLVAESKLATPKVVCWLAAEK